MRNILAFLAAGVIILGGLGWYLGWFRFQSAPTADGHREVKIDVALTNSFGFGGHNATLVLRKYDGVDGQVQPRSH